MPLLASRHQQFDFRVSEVAGSGPLANRIAPSDHMRGERTRINGNANHSQARIPGILEAPHTRTKARNNPTLRDLIDPLDFPIKSVGLKGRVFCNANENCPPIDRHRSNRTRQFIVRDLRLEFVDGCLDDSAVA